MVESPAGTDDRFTPAPEVSCPTCGSSGRVVFSRGFYQCTNARSAFMMLPHPVHPRFGMVREDRLIRCGTVYQAGAPTTPAVVCSLCTSYFAIGLCISCRRPVDMFHASTAAQGLICSDCSAARAVAQAEELAAEDAARLQAQAAAEAAAAVNAAADVSAEHVRVEALPTVEYLQEVLARRLPRSERSATGEEIARALAPTVARSATGGVKGRGGVRVDDGLLLPDGTVIEERHGLRRPDAVGRPDKEYSPMQVNRMLWLGAKWGLMP